MSKVPGSGSPINEQTFFSEEEIAKFKRGMISPRCKNTLINHLDGLDCGGFYRNGKCISCGSHAPKQRDLNESDRKY